MIPTTHCTNSKVQKVPTSYRKLCFYFIVIVSLMKKKNKTRILPLIKFHFWEKWKFYVASFKKHLILCLRKLTYFLVNFLEILDYIHTYIYLIKPKFLMGHSRFFQGIYDLCDCYLFFRQKKNSMIRLTFIVFILIDEFLHTRYIYINM